MPVCHPLSCSLGEDVKKKGRKAALIIGFFLLNLFQVLRDVTNKVRRRMIW